MRNYVTRQYMAPTYNYNNIYEPGHKRPLFDWVVQNDDTQLQFLH